MRSHANAQFSGSIIVKTGVCDGICNDDWIFKIKSTLSVNGGHAMTGCAEFAAQTPESAFERPAIVTKITFFSVAKFSSKIKTSRVFLCADIMFVSCGICKFFNFSVIFNACVASAFEPKSKTTLPFIFFGKNFGGDFTRKNLTNKKKK